MYIVGLGNPGEEYERSRHNAGFMFADALASKLGLNFKFEKKFHGEVARASGGNIVLIKPMTYMNDSGVCVRGILDFYKEPALEGNDAELHNVYVAYDDLDIELGQFKKQFATHPKIHNGVNSIIASLHTDKFWNVRLGTDTRAGDRAQQGREFVLKPLTSEEITRLADLIQNVVQEVHAEISAT